MFKKISTSDFYIKSCPFYKQMFDVTYSIMWVGLIISLEHKK